MGTTQTQQVVPLKKREEEKKRWMAFLLSSSTQQVKFLWIYAFSVTASEQFQITLEGALQRLRINPYMTLNPVTEEKVTTGLCPWGLSRARGRGSSSFGDLRAPRPCVPPDEHVPVGEHRHAELGTPAALHQDLPGAPGAARLPRLAQRPAAGPAHLDVQPQRHPHGSRRQGAPLHGLGLRAASSGSQVSKPRVPPPSAPAPHPAPGSSGAAGSVSSRPRPHGLGRPAAPQDGRPVPRLSLPAPPHPRNPAPGGAAGSCCSVRRKPENQ